MEESQAPTITAAMARASELLEHAEFTRVASARAGKWPTTNARVYEDAYSFAAITAFDTWNELEAAWMDAQESLVQLISSHVARGEAKAWEGYLVLLTPSLLSEDARRAAREIRSDATFVRKLVASGDELRRPDGLEQVMRPLLPIVVEAAEEDLASALDLLPGLLERRGYSADAVQTLVDAFASQNSLVESLHTYLAEGGSA